MAPASWLWVFTMTSYLFHPNFWAANIPDWLLSAFRETHALFRLFTSWWVIILPTFQRGSTGGIGKCSPLFPDFLSHPGAARRFGEECSCPALAATALLLTMSRWQRLKRQSSDWGRGQERARKTYSAPTSASILPSLPLSRRMWTFSLSKPTDIGAAAGYSPCTHSLTFLILITPIGVWSPVYEACDSVWSVRRTDATYWAPGSFVCYLEWKTSSHERRHCFFFPHM